MTTAASPLAFVTANNSPPASLAQGNSSMPPPTITTRGSAGVLAVTNVADQMLVLLRNNAERRIGDQQRLAAQSVRNQLHPSQRFGSNKGLPATAAGATPVFPPPSPTHAAVAASRNKLFGQSSSTSSGVQTQATSAPLQKPLTRVGSLMAAGTNNTTAAKGAASRRRASFAPLPPSVGVLPGIDPEYLLHPPQLPPRKVLCQVQFMRELISRARDATYAGIRKYRADTAASKAALAAEQDPEITADESSAGVPSALLPVVRIHVAVKKTHTGAQPSDSAAHADAFTIPPEFLDVAVLDRYADYGWIASLVANTPPHYSIAAMAGVDPGLARRKRQSVARP